MTIDQEIAIRSVFVLAHARVDQRRVTQSRQSGCQSLPYFGQTCFRHDPIAFVRIEWRAVTINGDLDSTPVHIRQAVDLFLEIDPRRHQRRSESFIAWGGAKVEDFLSGWIDATTENVSKYFREPRAASKNKFTGRDSPIVRRCDRVQPACAARRLYTLQQIFDAIIDRSADDCLHRPTRHQHAAVRLNHRPRNSIKIELRITSSDFTYG